MKDKILFLTLIVFSLSAVSQSKLEFKFDQARVFLAKGELNEALTLMHPLEEQLPDNANISFFLGAAYTELNQAENAIKHLIKAARKIKVNYLANSYEEKAAPVHVFYYLTLAFAESNQCANSHEAYDSLKRHKQIMKPYYLEEARKYTMKCPVEDGEKGQLAELLKEDGQPTTVAELIQTPKELIEEVAIDSAALLQRGMLVQKLEYTTKTPLYGVQIASHSRPVPIGSYSNIKNADVFVGTNGEI